VAWVTDRRVSVVVSLDAKPLAGFDTVFVRWLAPVFRPLPAVRTFLNAMR
jgi:hypothetical protein